MSLKNLMDNYTAFNLWANTAIANWLLSKPAEILHREVASSYPSIIGTLIHIWNTEVFWLELLQGGAPVFKSGFTGTHHEAIQVLLAQSAKFAAHVASMPESELIEILTLDAPWMKGTLPKYEYVQHCMNHSTYHRGQVITIARNLGLTDPPMTDYNYYNMVIKKGM